MFEDLKQNRRWLMEVPLGPVQGSRFQPTGFADLGAARYLAPDGKTWMLLVESAQSMANRLEATIVGEDGEIVPELAGLSYIRVRLQGDSSAVTTSLVEPHRINSPFIITDRRFQDAFKEQADYAKGKPLNWSRIARTLFRFDVNSLLHGCFLANLGDDGEKMVKIKMQRALGSFIEASGVREAVSGGVKNNPIDPTGKLRVVGYDKDVYSNVPYQRVEYTAERITAYFNLDVGQIVGFGLPAPAVDLLIALAMLKVRRFLDGGLRLRTACDLVVTGEPRVTSAGGSALPDATTLLERVQGGIRGCREVLGDPPVTEIRTTVKFTSKGTEESSQDEE